MWFRGSEHMGQMDTLPVTVRPSVKAMGMDIIHTSEHWRVDRNSGEALRVYLCL